MSCNWPIDRTCLPAVSADDDEAKARLAIASDLAVSVLWALSGRQFGQCPVIVRPCPETRPGRYGELVGYTGPGWFPIWDGGNWRNVSCGCEGTTCRESGPSLIHLPGPVGEIIEIKIGDTVLPPSTYSLEGDRLYNGSGPWPSQDLSIPVGSSGTWSVTFTQGNPVPAGVGTFVGILAKEFYLACSGGAGCRIPRNVTSVQRKGVSYQMVDTAGIYSSGKTGLAEIDLWLASVNPNKLMAGPSVR